MMKENWVYCRGDIYCANLDPVVGSEQGGIRPVIVIQNDTGNKHAPTLIVATVTTRIHKKANMPTHFVITSSYIVTLTCTCNVHQKSKALLISSQSDGVKSL